MPGDDGSPDDGAGASEGPADRGGERGDDCDRSASSVERAAEGAVDEGGETGRDDVDEGEDVDDEPENDVLDEGPEHDEAGDGDQGDTDHGPDEASADSTDTGRGFMAEDRASGRAGRSTEDETGTSVDGEEPGAAESAASTEAAEESETTEAAEESETTEAAEGVEAGAGPEDGDRPTEGEAAEGVEAGAGPEDGDRPTEGESAEGEPTAEEAGYAEAIDESAYAGTDADPEEGFADAGDRALAEPAAGRPEVAAATAGGSTDASGNGASAATESADGSAAAGEGAAAPSDADSNVPADVRKYDRFKKVDGAQYERVNEFLRDRTYITAREWAIARLCADFRTETGVEMTKIGQNLPHLVPFMTDTYTPQAVNQARSSFEGKVRKAGATFLYGAMSDFLTADELDDLMYEVTEVAKFLLEVEGVDLAVEEELDAEERISSVMREVRRASDDLRFEGTTCPNCGHEIGTHHRDEAVDDDGDDPGIHAVLPGEDDAEGSDDGAEEEGTDDGAGDEEVDDDAATLDDDAETLAAETDAGPDR